ncbi:HIRAN domain-containing protein [Pseudochrobactrum sp. XF203]|uniref:HIRAN domain-containing protein n=1 Tax=Pseudochrobactrum sp. XF203 TaxID=2879116 RepID=UPI001CE33A48|nr:HIRAN domain-containing protein [Pseudochrobactrum sp. XF203]UCA44766.1 HIRAN domain-containing protein [Pseudochrobactrum sp. XF203]
MKTNIRELLIEFGENPDQQYIESQIAGLQFYKYSDSDEMSDKLLRPQAGDRIQFIRNPDNEYDENAIEIWFKNGQHMLGHVPARLAAVLAPQMDAGKLLKGYFLNEGDGRAWSVSALLLGPALPPEPPTLPKVCPDKCAFDEWDRENRMLAGEWVWQ